MADRSPDNRTPSDETTEAPDIAGLQAQNASLQDRLLRALADAENVRRRADRTAHEARNYAVADLARELLTVVDNLRRAIDAAGDPSGPTAGTASLVEGIRAIERSLTTMLERVGVRRIEARGAAFDPSRHEAIMEVVDPERAPGSVVDVMEDGYTIHDRLLRPARVSVTRGRPATTEAEGPAWPEDRGSYANRGG
ncbi:nucleotide exchange factor GrpE [Altererythrobacter sp. Root672]|uniref:nucleotide exchange factor GrpE n=1 Tax=Altererythrobacter sp. Root672 TaxID=1736584 RepID=UPI0009EB6F2D|nr:nucleotide exchange factor GrpE [Altererythrobacter sp. Root672]